MSEEEGEGLFVPFRFDTQRFPSTDMKKPQFAGTSGSDPSPILTQLQNSRLAFGPLF